MNQIFKLQSGFSILRDARSFGLEIGQCGFVVLLTVADSAADCLLLGDVVPSRDGKGENYRPGVPAGQGSGLVNDRRGRNLVIGRPDSSRGKGTCAAGTNISLIMIVRTLGKPSDADRKGIVIEILRRHGQEFFFTEHHAVFLDPLR